MASVVASTHDSKTDLPPRVLVVDDEPNLRDVIEDAAQRGVQCKVVTAASLAEARAILVGQSINLLIADVNLPDGDGTTLLPVLQRYQPNARAIVITGAPTLANAIKALREGAVDFVPKPFTHQQLVDCMRSALDHQARAHKQDRRYTRLKTAVKRLNASRRLISKKVDLLCNDLVSAYGDLSRQLDDVRIQENFRKAIQDAKDLEQLLCHAMDWMLRQVGYCNVAVYLAADDGEFQLGAYMKYTQAGDAPVTDAIKRVLLPPLCTEGTLHVNAAKFEKQFKPQDFQFFKGHDILGVNCTYLGESLAGIVFFRDARTPFTTDDETLVRSISAIFAVALASVVRDSNDEQDSDADAAPDSGGLSDGPSPKKDPADWWKHGEESPF